MERDLSLLRFDTAEDLDDGLAAWLVWFSRTRSTDQLIALVEQLEAARLRGASVEPAEAWSL